MPHSVRTLFGRRPMTDAEEAQYKKRRYESLISHWKVLNPRPLRSELRQDIIEHRYPEDRTLGFYNRTASRLQGMLRRTSKFRTLVPGSRPALPNLQRPVMLADLLPYEPRRVFGPIDVHDELRRAADGGVARGYSRAVRSLVSQEHLRRNAQARMALNRERALRLSDLHRQSRERKLNWIRKGDGSYPDMNLIYGPKAIYDWFDRQRHVGIGNELRSIGLGRYVPDLGTRINFNGEYNVPDFRLVREAREIKRLVDSGEITI